MANPTGVKAKPADKRLLILGAALKKVQSRSDALIEVLHKAQELFGYLDDTVLWFVARGLKLPPSRVYGVATFYHLFRLKPPGKHTCVVCTGTACFVKGSADLLDKVEQMSGTRLGQTSADGNLSILAARCVGTCGIAPVVVLDGEMIGPITPNQLGEKIKGWQIDGHA